MRATALRQTCLAVAVAPSAGVAIPADQEPGAVRGCVTDAEGHALPGANTNGRTPAEFLARLRQLAR